MTGTMKALGARWNITDQADGQKAVVYINLCTGCRFECGVIPAHTATGLILEFILDQGNPGDMVFLNDQFYTQTHKEMSA